MKKLYLALRKLDPLMKGALQDASLAIAGKAIRSCSSVCYLHYISSFALPELAMRRRLGKRGLNKRNCRLVEFDHSLFLSNHKLRSGFTLPYWRRASLAPWGQN